MAARKSPSPGRRPTSRANQRSGGSKKSHFLTALVGLAIAGSTTAAIIGYFSFQSLCGTPCVDLERLKNFRPDEGSRIYDRQGQEIGMLYRENRRVISLKEMPEHVVRAFIDVEDKRFYKHNGIDYPRILGAIWANVQAGGVAEGFSTLTMQLARNAYPEVLPYTQKTITRKLMEVRVAQDIEGSFTKDEILERYLNTIYLGAGAYGVEAAARAYFGKTVKELTVEEAALLAGLPKAPSRYNPYKNSDLAKQRRDIVLSLMHNGGSITEEQYRSARQAPIRLAHESADEATEILQINAPYFIEEIRKELETHFGQELYRGGLRIFTSLDSKIQQVAEQELEAQLSKIEKGELGGFDPKGIRAKRDTTSAADAAPVVNTSYIQGAVLVMDSESGDVLALVGGRDFNDSRFNRATQALRQPGSVFKPFIYASAIAAGCAPEDLVSNGEVTVQLETGDVWTPANFDNKDSTTVTTMRQALKLSRNRAAVWLSQQVGLDKVIEHARSMGIQSDIPAYPSVVLGSIDVKMTEVATAYSPLSRDDGYRVEPRLVTRVEDGEGNILLLNPTRAEKAISPAVAYVLRDMMEDVVNHGTGYEIRKLGYKGPAAGKTGTTNNSTDTWFVGVTPRMVAAVWVGFDQPRPILRGTAATGGRLAAPVWGSIMKAVEDTVVSEGRWSMPEGVGPGLRVAVLDLEENAGVMNALENAAVADSIAVANPAETPDSTTVKAGSVQNPQKPGFCSPRNGGSASGDSLSVDVNEVPLEAEVKDASAIMDYLNRALFKSEPDTVREEVRR